MAPVVTLTSMSEPARNLTKTVSFAHPLDPLTADEIVAASTAIRIYVGSLSGRDVRPERIYFNTITLLEPPKVSVLKWNGLVPIDQLPAYVPPLKRQAEVFLLCPLTRLSFEAIVDLPSNLPGSSSSKPTVSRWKLLSEKLQLSLQVEELLWAEVVCRESPEIQKIAREVGVKPENLYCDGKHCWCIANDERFPGRRLQQCFMFARDRPGDNLYAHPLDFIPVIDSHTGEILAVDFPQQNPGPSDLHPPSSAAAQAVSAPRARISPPMASDNYLPEQRTLDDRNFKLREGLKPLHVVQPEGVSYRLEGRTLKWQNWSVHVGFNYRDGLVLSNITYDDGMNGTRPLFYRLSVAEMVVPYAKTTYPHHRKHAFDTGEYGIGALSNSLALGCDCLGSITYLDAHIANRAGQVDTIKSAICIHEEDAGLLHKHTDFRDNAVHVARNRKLIVSSICTVANYEYAFYFSFGLDGAIELESKLTGIVNAYVLGPNEPGDLLHETVVAPQIAAQHHQHLFSFRIDPLLDGLRNSVSQIDAVPDPALVGSPENFYGNGFHARKTTFKTAKQAVSDYDSSTHRIWAIENRHKQHFASGHNVAYKIICRDMPPLMAKPGSMVWNRAPFARHGLFVTPYAEDTLYPCGFHVNQSEGGEVFGLQEWVEQDGKVEDEDVVVWLNFGATHFARPEDWPIMPVESVKVHLKPSNFFERNPGLDVPGKKDIASRNANEAFASSTTSTCCPRL